MFWSNYHSHCTFCDGRASMEDFVKFALAKGMKKYGFSSHAPLPFLTMWTMKEDDFFDYNAEFLRLKRKYQGQIDLFLGLEVDYIHNYSSIRNTFFQDKTFDYLIGSIHYVDKIPNGRFWNIDGDLKTFDNGLQKIFDGDIKEAVKRFFEVSKFMIETGGFDILGHMDKIALNARKYTDFNLKDKWYIQLVEETLELARLKGIMVEINTKSFFDKGFTFPHQQHFGFINDMQIPMVVNSDCHYPTNVTDSFRPVYKLLKEAGFKNMYQLSGKNKWESVNFDENGLLFNN